MKFRFFVLATALFFSTAVHAANLSFSVSFPASMSAPPLDGHVTLLIAKGTPSDEPRNLVSSDEPLKSPFIFGLTVDGLKPGAPAVLDAHAFGWPLENMNGLKPGDYTVQAVLNRYETFHRADGTTLKLPPEMGEGQQWAKKPGNLYSKPFKIHIDPAHDQRVAIVLDQKIAAIPDKKDTPLVKHIRIKSELLSKFWGRPVYLGAHVLGSGLINTTTR
jgi:hypothetical protein